MMVCRNSRKLLAMGAIVLLFQFLSLPVVMAQAVEALAKSKLEERARTLSRSLRCVVCQNQSIDDSNAPLAKDLRVLVRERLLAGDSDAAAVKYIVARYGNFVLLKPPLQLNTLMLWLAPFLLMLVASGVMVRAMSEGTRVATPHQPLSKDERKTLNRLLDQGDET